MLMPTTESRHEKPHGFGVAAFVSGLLVQPLPPTRPLSLPDLRQRVEAHNNQQLLLGIFLIVGSCFAWIMSFTIIFAFFAFIFRAFGLPALLALVPAVLGILALIGYGVWNVSSILRQDGKDVLEQMLESALMESSLRWQVMDLVVAISMLIEILLCAPKSAVMSIQAFRSALNAHEQVLEQACSIRRQLFENRDRQRWMPLDNFTAWPRALFLLHRLKLITVDERDRMVRLAS
jgi:hypothetical protein